MLRLRHHSATERHSGGWWTPLRVAFDDSPRLATSQCGLAVLWDLLSPFDSQALAQNPISVSTVNVRTTIRHAIGLLALLGCAALNTATAQSLTYGRLDGMLRDESRRPVAAAELRIIDRASGASRSTLSGRDGAFRFSALPAGRYDLHVEALGFRPLVHLDVEIGAGGATEIEAIVRSSPPPVVAIDTVVRRGDARSSGSWMFEKGYADLVSERRLLGEVSALSSVADEWSVEGLPWRLTETVVDGARGIGVAAPFGLGADGAGLAFPIRSLASARVGGLGFDVETGGSGVGLRGSSVRGGRAMSTQSIAEGGSANLGGAFIIGGPLQGDTAQALLGVDYQRAELQRGDDATTANRVDERASAFGRFDWNLGDRLAISVRGSGSSFTSGGPAERVGTAARFGGTYEAMQAQLAVSVLGRLTERLSHEWRLSTDVGSVSGDPDSLPRTNLVPLGLGLGSEQGEPFEETRTTPRVSGTLHADFGAHRVKVGFATAMHGVDARYARDAAGEFVFGRMAATPLPGEGVWRGVEPASFAGEFRMTESAFFIQDEWRVAPGLTLTLGGRVEGQSLPLDRIERNAEWAQLTALDNADVSAPRARFSPRFGLRWELGGARQWLIEGGAGVFNDLPDRRDIAEALTFDRSADVRYEVGALSSWPASPDGVDAPVIGRTLTTLGPKFEGPSTKRMSLGLTRRMGSWNSSVRGVYRHTDFLSRRRDLNLPSAEVGRDQHQRPLYGSLQQQGSAVTVSPGTNRRFAQLDAAHVLESTGISEYWGVTAGLERVREQGVSLSLHYTFSHTRDNVGSFLGTRISPFPELVGDADWLDGRSDLDVPHRLVAALDWSLSDAFRLGVVYRLSSGLPFTPGVRTGVDANGDGDWRNDPAFVDAALTGMDAVIADNACLEGQVGRFAERNSCRGDLLHRVDVRAAIGVARLRIGQVAIVVDALDLMATALGTRDHALVLVDENAALSTNGTTGVTTVPYIVNPNFGALLGDRSAGPLWRVGLRITP